MEDLKMIVTLVSGLGVGFLSYKLGVFILSKKYSLYKPMSYSLIFMSFFMFLFSLMGILIVYLNFEINSLLLIIYITVVSTAGTKYRYKSI